MTEKSEGVANNNIIDRRSYLKATVGAAAFAGVFTKGAAASEEYDVIKLEPGEHRTHDLSEGEVWENKLIDQTARGALFRVRALGLDGFTIRNIGWLGVPTDVGGGRHVMHVTTSSGGDGVVENCYISGKLTSADGDTEPSPAGGMRVPPDHQGTIEFRNNFVEGLGNNASYADPPGEAANGQGTVIYENCYHRDNTVSQFRIGSSGSTVRNSLAVVDDPSGERGRYPYSGRQTARGVWAWHTDDLWVENSTIYLSDQDSGADENVEARVQDDSGSSPSCVVTLDGVYTNENPTWNERVNISDGSATIRFQDVREGEPTASVLGEGGVPTAAEMAASGSREYVDPFNEGITSASLDDS